MKTLTTGFLKKYLVLFGLMLLPTLSFSQIKLSQPMSPGGTFGLIDVNELKGGLMMVDSLELRDEIFIYRAKKGMMMIVADAGAAAGYQTKTFMFLPSENPADYADAGKIWNTYDEYQVHTIAEFVAKYGLNPWVEVSLGLKDPSGAGIDSIFISTSFIDTIYSNTGDTLFLMDKVKADSLYANTFNLSGIQILGISTDATFANASNDSLVTQLAIKTYVQNELSSLTSNASISKLVVDTLIADTAFINTLRNNVMVSDSINVDTLIALYTTIDTASINKVSVNYFTLDGYWLASVSNDTLFSSADSTALITEFAVQNRIDSVITYVNNEFSSLSQNSIENPLNAGSRIEVNQNDSLIFMVNNDTAMVIAPDGSVNVNDFVTQQLTISGVTIGGISTDITMGGALASNNFISTQYAVKTYVDDRFIDLSKLATIEKLNVDTLIALYSSMDTASINKVNANYFTMNGVWVASISNDTVFTSADSTALITEFAVQNRIDSVITYVNNEFSSLSQNSIENPLNSSTRITVNENDSLVFTVNGDTAMVVTPDGTIHTNTLATQQLILAGDTLLGVSKDGTFALASNDSLATQLAVKTYVDAEVLKLSGSTSTDTLRAQVAFIGDSYIDSLNADTAMIVRLSVDTLFMDSDTIYAIAKTGEVVADADLEKTVVTAGYVKNNASAFPEGLNPVTRNGWTGVSGQDLDADNVVDFLKKVFFPVPEPRIASIGVAGAYSTETLTSVTDPNGGLTESIATFDVPYATWKSGLSLGIAYNVVNRSALDADIADTDIETISIEQGTYTPAALPIGNSLTPLTGNFPTVVLADLNPAPSATANNTYTFTTKVTDAYPNLNTLDWNVRLLAGQKLAITGFTITAPTLVEGDGNDKTVRFNWAINNNEDVITSIDVNQELPSASTIATGSTTASSFYDHTITAPAAQGTYTYRYDLSVGSQVYASNVVSALNRTYIISDRHFWGYVQLTKKQQIDALANGAPLVLTTFFTNPPYTGNVLNKNWIGSQADAGNSTGASSANGVAFSTATAGDVYACIAIPRTTASVELHQWDDLNKFWVNQAGLVAKPITYTVGTLVKNYWIVYSTTAFSSTASPIFRVVEK